MKRRMTDIAVITVANGVLDRHYYARRSIQAAWLSTPAAWITTSRCRGPQRAPRAVSLI